MKYRPVLNKVISRCYPAATTWLHTNIMIVNALLLVFSCFSAHATAGYQAQIAYMQGEGDVQGIKLALQRSSPFYSELLQKYGIGGELHFEVSANFWRYQPHNQTDQNLVIALSPVWTKQIGLLADKPLNIELGIGVSILDDTRFAGKDVSTHYQFEDRIGLQWQMTSTQSLYFRYMHYSNAGLKKPNPGLDFISIGYSQSF